jgi:RND family efflux transporter MFP subunit
MLQKTSKVLKTIIWVLVLLSVAAGAGYYFYSESIKAAPVAEVKVPVQTVVSALVQKQDFPVLLETMGNTVAVNLVDIRPQVTNVVVGIHVRDGQMVSKGDLLFTLDDRVDKANLEKAVIAADDAKRQLERAQELVKQQFLSQSAVDTALTNAKATAAAVNAAQALLSYDTIRSPINGRIGIINVFPGALVQPGNSVSTATTSTTTTTQGAMVTVTQLNPINVQFNIPESVLPSFFEAQKKGQKLAIEFEVAGRMRTGRIFVIDNQVDAAIGSVRAKAVVDNADHSLLPGQFIRLKAIAGVMKDVLVVPTQAVVRSTRGEQIYVVNPDQTVALKPVKVLAQAQGQSMISGLEEGERVITEGKQNLRPNSKIREAAAKGEGK